MDAEQNLWDYQSKSQQSKQIILGGEVNAAATSFASFPSVTILNRKCWKKVDKRKAKPVAEQFFNPLFGVISYYNIWFLFPQNNISYNNIYSFFFH